MGVTPAGESVATTRRRARFRPASLLSLELFVSLFLVAYFGLIFVLPVVQTIWYSLNAYDVLTDSGIFVGLRNYGRALADPLFWNGLRVAFTYVLIDLPIGLCLQLGLAALYTMFRGLPRSILMVGFFLSAVLPNMAVIMIWRNVYRVDFGLFDVAAAAVGLPPVPWLTDGNLALMSIVILTLWKWLGWGAVIFLAGLNEIPEPLYEAATIDGAGGLRQFFSISLPLLRPLILVQVIFSVITLLQFFDPFYGLTGGGPSGATKTLILHIYESGWVRLNFSYAAAMTTFLFFILLAASAIQLYYGRRSLR